MKVEATKNTRNRGFSQFDGGVYLSIRVWVNERFALVSIRFFPSFFWSPVVDYYSNATSNARRIVIQIPILGICEAE